MNFISQVEYFSRPNLIRVSSQFVIEAAIMEENISRFKLAYSSPLLQQLLLQRFGLCSDTKEAYSLIHDSALIDFSTLPKILSLFQKNNTVEIPSAITLSEWTAH